MSDIVTEGSGGILRVELNRPDHKNALTSNRLPARNPISDDLARFAGLY
jgi:enoyl-CoA hydratase/carnithine racemase